MATETSTTISDKNVNLCEVQKKFIQIATVNMIEFKKQFLEHFENIMKERDIEYVKAGNVIDEDYKNVNDEIRTTMQLVVAKTDASIHEFVDKANVDFISASTKLFTKPKTSQTKHITAVDVFAKKLLVASEFKGKLNKAQKLARDKEVDDAWKKLSEAEKNKYKEEATAAEIAAVSGKKTKERAPKKLTAIDKFINHMKLKPTDKIIANAPDFVKFSLTAKKEALTKIWEKLSEEEKAFWEKAEDVKVTEPSKKDRFLPYKCGQVSAYAKAVVYKLEHSESTDFDVKNFTKLTDDEKEAYYMKAFNEMKDKGIPVKAEKVSTRARTART